jgi:hypothetical protein
MGFLRHASVFACLVGLVAFPEASWAGDGSPEKRAVILVRALSYDANLKDRVGDDLVIAVVGRKGNVSSEACSTGMRQGLGVLSGARVAGVPLKVMQFWYGGIEPLASAVGPQGIDALYLCEGLEGDLPAILDVAKKNQILTMCGSEEQVNRGTALGVVFIESKPTLFVNLTAAKSAGAALSSDLLRVARVIR